MVVTATISQPTQRQTTMTSIQQLTKVLHTEKPGKTLHRHTHYTHTQWNLTSLTFYSVKAATATQWSLGTGWQG